MARRSLTHVAWLSVLATPLSAQAVATFDVDGARVRYTDSLTITAASVTPGFRLTRPSALVLGSGTVSRFDNNTWSGQGSLVATGFTRPHGRFRGEVGGATGGSIHQDGSGVAYLLGRARAHIQSGVSGVWAGAGAGSTWDGTRWRSLFLGEGAVWTRVQDATLLATITPTAVADSGSYVDFEASVRWDRGAIEAAAWLGGRTQSGSSRGWAGVSATGWIARHVAVTGGAGSYPDDVTQSVPAGRYLTLGLRLSSEPRVRRALVNRMLARDAPLLTRPVAASFELSNLGESRRMLRFKVPGVQRVELMGTFTDWEIVELSQAAPGQWEVTLTIAPGTYRMNLRVDGGEWGVPPGVPVLRDDFGGVVGILVVR